MKRVRLGFRLSLTFGLLAAAVLGVATIGLLRLDSLNAEFSRVMVERHARAMLVRDILGDFGVMARSVSDALLVENRAVHLQHLEKARRNVSGLLAKLDQEMAADDQEAKLLLQTVHDRNAAYLVNLTRFTRLLAADRIADANHLLNAELRAGLDSAGAAMQQLSALQGVRMERSQAEAASAYRNARNLTFLLSAVAVLVSLGVAAWLARRVTRPLGEAVDIAGRVAAGDLTAEVVAAGTDETGELLAALARMNESLTRMVHGVRGSSDAIAGAASGLLAGNRRLLQRAEEQATSLEESASSIEEMTASVKHNSANAAQADKIARGAATIAGRGAQVMEEVIANMASIQESARKVEQIIGVIDGIAFQTNILALNAAVEAARAGTQGRGFAVVASEVRSLSQRSAEAAKEIKALIRASSVKVGDGSRLVGEAGDTMSEIVANVTRVSGLVAEIAGASREQSCGIEQINQALAHMEQMTQQNASLAQDSTLAVEALEAHARSLVDAVGVFRLDDQSWTDSAAAPAAAAPGLHRPAPIRARLAAATS